MEIITSVKNSLIVQTKKIKENPGNKLFIENPKLIKEAFLTKQSFDYVLIDKDKIEKFKTEYSFLFSYKCFIVGKNVLQHLSDTKNPQGVVAIINFEDKELKIPKSNFLVLENIQDPGNLGTIIRSAKGTTFTDIYLINCVGYLNQKVIRSAMGNIFDVNLYKIDSTQTFIDFAKTNKLNLAMADMYGENLYNIKKSLTNFGIVIGNEGKGVSEEMRKIVKKSISIPMKNGLESLNAGVSCSIIIYYLDNII